VKLPSYAQAVIASSKILKYLLDENHPRGKDKAIFFMRFGFSKEAWEQLADALLAHVANNEVTSTRSTPKVYTMR
jgi:hypothetical protein